MTDAALAQMPNAIRILALDAVKAANSGHSGMPMGMADAATVLFTRHMKIDPSNPNWPDRDRFVLSAGHGSMLIYAVNHLLGYKDMTIEQIKNFRQLGSITAGHPEHGHADGVETTTGPLGQGIANAVGMALAEKMLAARFGADLVDHYTYVFAGDGCLMEGISHEAIDLAGHLNLSKLIVLFDDNAVTIDGTTDMSTSMDQKTRFSAAGWEVMEVDGHDMDALDAAIETAKRSDKPTMIACKTIIGFGAPTLAGKPKAHGAITGDDEIAGVRDAVGWPHDPFVIPDDVMQLWRNAGAEGAAHREAWEARLAKSTDGASFTAAMSGKLPDDFTAQMNAHKEKMAAEAPKLATRAASGKALEVINAATPLTVGGSADLTGSNNTKSPGMTDVTAADASGRYINYGVREHIMASAMNGIALHGGFIPYAGTFLVFTDYARPAIRLSALMGQRVIYVMTHDSIGVGEDGPTHQPVEHVAALRTIPNLNVFRPCDAVETAEAWMAALEDENTPTVLALSRQGLAAARTEHTPENLTAKGGYVLREADGPRSVTLIASGSEVEIALAAAQSIPGAAVVSMPSWNKFDAQTPDYRASVLGSAPRLAIEAGVEMGWSKYTGNADAFVGMSSFGASAPAGDLFKHFGITAEAVIAKAETLV